MTSHKLIGQVLIELGMINQDQLEAGLALQKKRKERIGELLFSLRFISEIDILKVLAERFKIRFLSSSKLSQINIPQNVLRLIPVDFAMNKFVLPLRLDMETNVLSVLVSHPANSRLIDEIRHIAAVREVTAYLALKPTIMAGVKKFYFEEVDSFDNLQENFISQQYLLNMGNEERSNSDQHGVMDASTHGMRLADEVVATSLMTDNLYVETLNILISMLELKKGPFRGHSASVARMVKNISEKLELLPREVYFNVVAAYFHDLGKREGIHHTLINLKTERDLKLAQKLYLAPVRLIEAANFPQIIPDILTHLFERFDGKGFPDGLRGEEIPLGSRIIAAVDAFEDLVRHPDWANKPIEDAIMELFHYQGTCFDRKVLVALNDSARDGSDDNPDTDGKNGQSILHVESTGTAYSDLVVRLKQAGFNVMVAKDTSSALEIMRKNSVEAVLADLRTTPMDAISFCRKVKTDPELKNTIFTIISNRDEAAKTHQAAFDTGADDFFTRPIRVDVVLAKIRLLLMRKKDSKLAGMHAQTTPPRASVTGNLSDLSLADVIQLLANGRKSGMLALHKDNEDAKVFISDGMVINCFYKGKTGEKAFYDLIAWEKGEFALETDCTMPQQEINMPTENLMLEGFRLLDEARAGR